MLSCVTCQTYLLEHEIFLIDYLNNSNREPLASCKCICLLRPTAGNISLLAKELSDPRYSEYHLCMYWNSFSFYIDFNNFLKGEDLEKLAEADEFEIVKAVEELYCDYFVATEHHFYISIPDLVGEAQLDSWNPSSLSRCADSLAATLLALRRKPVIRYSIKFFEILCL